MAVISNLDIVLGAKTDKLDSGLDRGRGKVQSWTQQVQGEFSKLASAIPGGDAVMGFASKLKGLGPVAGGAVAGVAAIGAAAAAGAIAVRGVNEQLKEIDNTGDAAKRLGISFNDLVVSRMALGRSSGLDEGTIDTSLQKMQMNLLKARDDGGALNDQLKSLGLDAGKLLEAGPVEALKQVSAAAQGMSEPIDQSKLAFDLFGKAGVGLVTALRDGPEAIEEMERRAKELGLTLSQTQVEQVGAANDAWDDMLLIATGVFRQIAVEVAPVMTAIITAVSETAKGFGGWEVMLPGIVDSVVTMAGYLYDGYEFSRLLSNSLVNIATLNWDGLKETISSAFSFDTGEKWVAKVQAARDEAGKAAAQPFKPPVDDSTFTDAPETPPAAAPPNVKEQKDAAADRIASLRDEILAIGRTSDELDRMRLAREGATQAQLAEIEALQAKKAHGEEMNELMERGKQLMLDNRTPMEQFEAKLADIEKLFSVGAIDRKTRDRERQSALGDLQLDKEPPKIGALQMGSVEAELQARKNEQGNSVAERGNKLLEQIDAKLGRMAEGRGPTLRMA